MVMVNFVTDVSQLLTLDVDLSGLFHLDGIITQHKLPYDTGTKLVIKQCTVAKLTIIVI